jgi:tRNA (mo5U34)-methyltransferase
MFVQSWESACQLGCQQLLAHGRFALWWQSLEALPPLETKLDLDCAAPRADLELEADYSELLRSFGPWKKGPFQIGELKLDAEWRSDLKWQRLTDHLGSVRGAKMLDVGTGNGYFLLRARGSGADSVLGLEPSAHYASQFLALQRFFPVTNMGLLPVTSEQFVTDCRAFDLVLSMGVLYHRRAPLDHISQLISFAKPGGRLVVETIVLGGQGAMCLCPQGRYANMRNVWFLPTVDTLVSWMKRLGLKDIECDQPIATTPVEQRSTSWSGPISLIDALDPSDHMRTVEGHPAPLRVIASAKVPG